MGGKSTIAASLCSGEDEEGDEMAFVWFMDCVPPQDAVDEAFGIVCL